MSLFKYLQYETIYRIAIFNQFLVQLHKHTILIYN